MAEVRLTAIPVPAGSYIVFMSTGSIVIRLRVSTDGIMTFRPAAHELFARILRI